MRGADYAMTTLVAAYQPMWMSSVAFLLNAHFLCVAPSPLSESGVRSTHPVNQTPSWVYQPLFSQLFPKQTSKQAPCIPQCNASKLAIMSGRGKGGKGLGKGGAKRHRKVLRDNIQGEPLALSMPCVPLRCSEVFSRCPARLLLLECLPILQILH